MILPIYAFGQPVLKKIGKDITKDYEGLEELILNMWETMYNAHGVGLAAPQIGKDIRLFLVDSVQMQKEGEDHLGIKKVFINAQLLDESGRAWKYEEGCLSIPDIRGDVSRQSDIIIEYYDEHFKKHKETYTGMNARVIQHEYDHIEGILFTEKLMPLRKRRVKRNLEKNKNGEIESDYRMRFVKV